MSDGSKAPPALHIPAEISIDFPPPNNRHFQTGIM
jgi:hypothetical protein